MPKTNYDRFSKEVGWRPVGAMKRTKNIAVLMILALLLGQVAVIVHFFSVPHSVVPGGYCIHSTKPHGYSHDGQEAPASGHHHEGECFALKWLTAPKTDVFCPDVSTWMLSGAPVAFSHISESEEAPTLEVLAVSPSQSPPEHA